MDTKSQKLAAKEFSEEWKGRGSEKEDCHPFWWGLLHEVFGIERPDKYLDFEKPVQLGHQSYIDVYIPETRVLIEQKSIDKDLDKPEPQSEGPDLTPVKQARRYEGMMATSEQPRWIITCNFREFWIYDEEHKDEPPYKIKLEDLPKEYHHLQFLVEEHDERLQHELEVSVAAGEIVGKLYDALHSRYADPDSEDSLHSLNVLCVRLVFCLYAENGGIFGHYAMFHDYMEQFTANQMRTALKELFEVLDTPEDKRDPYMQQDKPELAAFPYVNGGLFSDENIEIPTFNDEIRELLLEQASAGFNWADISPTIFGAVFESTLNPETRRSGGMHYTSVENIHKVIDPLFLDDLTAEFDEIQAIAVEKTHQKKLQEFQKKLAGLTFLDPACGSGNFLTETYLSLRRLENQVVSELTHGQITLGDTDFTPIMVSLNQFYGIEINDFAVTVAKTALWIAEAQMMQETENIVHKELNFLPLKSYTNIVEGNALRMDWNEVVPSYKLNYIMGNPPFSGARLMGANQKEDVNYIFSGWKNVGNLDYVCCWFKKATDYIKPTEIRCAFVATNSVCQGESVADLWKPLMESGVHIDFAYRTFNWSSEAKSRAGVHCIIVGFSVAPYSKEKFIYTDGIPTEAKNINGYLIDADDIFIESRNTPICNVPEIGIGNKPIDGGFYLFDKDEMEDFLKKEPAAQKYFKPWYGAMEFIMNKPRYCLWLGDCSPAELQSMPECLKRVEEVRQYRLASKSAGTRKLADKPTRFHVENMPKGNFIVIPETTTSSRKYIPLGYMDDSVLCSNLVKIMPHANSYHFGILNSNVHNAWLRAVGGRFRIAYRYSKDIVYNNFPWPDPTPEQKARIEQTAQEILDVRAKYPDSSLADLYDVKTMPSDLRMAHHKNDDAVMQAYGWGKGSDPYSDESACVAELMKLYQQKMGQ